MLSWQVSLARILGFILSSTACRKEMRWRTIEVVSRERKDRGRERVLREAGRIAEGRRPQPGGPGPPPRADATGGQQPRGGQERPGVGDGSTAGPCPRRVGRR